MPSLESDELNRSPISDPLTYPGKRADGNYLMVEEWLYHLAPQRGSGVGDWVLGIDGGPLRRAAGSARPHLDLHRALRKAKAAPMDQRVPVLAIGSNASPGQMLHKLSRPPRVPGVIPVTRGLVRGLAIGHAAHVSRPGYVPYVAVSAGPGRSRVRRSLAVLWLDEQQLERTDQTEPNYELVSIDGGRHQLMLDSGETLGRYGLFRGRYGALRGEDGGRLVEATTQASVLSLLSGHEWFRALVPAGDPVEIVERLRTDGGLREEVKRQMAARGLGCDDGIGARAEGPDALLGPFRRRAGA